jgi:hypothetical protein
MGSPISGTMAEIFFTTHWKQTHQTAIGLQKHNLLH